MVCTHPGQDQETVDLAADTPPTPFRNNMDNDESDSPHFLLGDYLLGKADLRPEPSEQDVDGALEMLARYAQTREGGQVSHQGLDIGQSFGLEHSLDIVGKSLALPRSITPKLLQFWPLANRAIAGTLYDSVDYLKGLPEGIRESYLGMLSYSLGSSGGMMALLSLQGHYYEAEPTDLGVPLRGMSTMKPSEARRFFLPIAEDYLPELSKCMPEICRAALEEDHRFFTALGAAVSHHPSSLTPLPARKLAALPQGSRNTERTAARRMWVSRGLWMLDKVALLALLPKLTDPTMARLTGDKDGEDGLYTLGEFSFYNKDLDGDYSGSEIAFRSPLDGSPEFSAKDLLFKSPPPPSE